MEEKNLSQMLGQAMSDPAFNEILTKLRSMDEKGDPALEALKNSIKSGNIPTAENVSAMLNGSHPLQNNGNKSSENPPSHSNEKSLLGDTEKHKRLISALRPYLSDEKKNAVDGIMKLSDYAGLADALFNTKNNGNRN